jgi:two-component system sensor histidine kinase UhpB
VSLFWRVFIGNAAIFAIGTAILALSPATVSWPIVAREGIVLAGGLAALLVANVFLLRIAFAPLERLTRFMRRIDLLKPVGRLPAEGGGEVGEVIRTFNDMLDRLESERRASAARVLAGQEEERRRIARELHDEVGQALTAVLLSLKRVAARAPADLAAELEEVQETARTSLEEIRRIARHLRPGVLEDLGLVSALTALTTAFSEASGIAVERRFHGPFPALRREAELAVYRIAQESLTNVARHAGATSVVLSLVGRDGVIVLEVADDGRGAGPDEHEGGGIRGMRERALAVGGALGVESNGSGVRVTLQVPVAEGGR